MDCMWFTVYKYIIFKIVLYPHTEKKLIISKKCFKQKSLPTLGVGSKGLPFLKYYNALEWENRFTLG